MLHGAGELNGVATVVGKSTSERRPTIKVISVALALLIAGSVAMPTYSTAFADTQTEMVKKKKKKTMTQSQRVKKNYRATLPGEPNQAGMTDDCAFWYNVHGYMPTGCDKYGRSIWRLWD